MSYLALYRKYRPVDFNNVYGQEEVVTVLKNAIVTGKISHAYLFCGPRGTGKTTIAKIVARLVNCDNLIDGNPCGKCYNCLNYLNSNDIVEIDAASNNGVDEIRELRDKVNLVPSNAKYKVYIIDEVHMLTMQAFNALLKTLEEPPSHVIFILATTEPHKIPLTISSRCQKFRFSKISDDKIVDRLKDICYCENISTDDDTLYEIARLSDGGMRDAINILDQLVAYSNGNITIDDVYKVNGSVSYNDLYNLLNNIIINNKIEIINFVDYLNNSGKDIAKFIEELLIFLKDVIIFKNTGIDSNISIKNEYIKLICDKYDDILLYELIESLNTIQNNVKLSNNSSIIFLTSILRYSDLKFKKDNLSICDINNNKNDVANLNEKLKNKGVIEDNNISREIIDIKKELDDDEINVRVNNALAIASKEVLDKFKDKWAMIDDYIDDEKYSIVSGLLKDSNLVVGSNDYIILSNKFQSIVDRMNCNLSAIENLLEKILGNHVYVAIISDEKWNIVKNKYINDIKSGKKYTLIKNENNNQVDGSIVKEKNNSIDQLIDLVGNNIIEYK
mgnify:FL=1